MHSFDLKVKAA